MVLSCTPRSSSPSGLGSDLVILSAETKVVVGFDVAVSVAVPGTSTPDSSNSGATNGSVLLYTSAVFSTVVPTG